MLWLGLAWATARHQHQTTQGGPTYPPFGKGPADGGGSFLPDAFALIPCSTESDARPGEEGDGV